MRRLLRRLFRSAALLITCAISLPVAIAGTVMGSFLFLPLPAVLPQPKVVEASRQTVVHTADGDQIAVFKDVEQKIPVNPKDIPDVLKLAVISAEDRNFYNHGGVDIRGSVRAFWADIHGGKVVQGGSTITQQYVKNVYTDKKRTLVRKVREAVLASQLERQTKKDDILFKYLSTIYLGDQAYGVGAASETYFREPVNQLTLSEAAMMAGLIPAPSSWAPRENPDAAESHRQLVLREMLNQKRISQEQFDQAIVQRVVLIQGDGPAPPNTTGVYQAVQAPTKYPEFTDYVKRYLTAKYGPNTVLRDGLDVTVTLDENMQNIARQQVDDALSGTNPELQMSVVAVEPQTGFVKAMISGRSFGSGKYGSDNFALGGCPRRLPNPADKYVVEPTCFAGTTISGGSVGRQAGSAFKPFTLATALSKGLTPEKVYPAPDVFNPPGCKQKNCQIHNAADGEGGGGSMTLRQATAKSVNTVYAQLIRDVGVKDTAEMAKRLGITSNSFIQGPDGQGVSYTLGTEPVSPLDMASAYGVFANQGQRANPIPVLLVKDANGKVLEDNTHPVTTPVIDPAVASNVTDVLRGPVSPGGTAYPRADIGRPEAGKTGTTDNYVDAWFVGYTPTLSTSVWMGYPANETTPMRGIKGFAQMFGGNLPAQTWHNFMLPALKDVPPTDFSQPAPITPPTVVDVNKQARGGIDPGTRSFARDTPLGGSFVQAPGAPTAVAPTTTTSQPPFDAGGGFGNGNGNGSDQTTTTTPTRSTLVPPRP